MKLLPVALALASAVLPLASAFIGMGIPMYDPVCAYACRAVISSADIACDDSHDHDGMDMDMGGMSMKMAKRHGHETDITPECRAMSEPFLTTLAYCINSTCPRSTEDWVLERYWSVESTGEESVKPMWGYTESLLMVNTTPATTYDAHERINETQLIASDKWEMQRGSLQSFAEGEAIHARYA